MIQSLQVGLLVTCICCTWTGASSAAPVTWTGANGTWQTGSNWEFSSEPDATSQVEISENVVVTINQSGELADTLLLEHATDAELKMTGGSLTVNLDFDLARTPSNQNATYTQTGGILTIGGNWNIATGNNADATVAISGGSVTVTGNINLSTSGNPQTVSITTVGAGVTVTADTVNIGKNATLDGDGTIDADVIVAVAGTLGSDLTITGGLKLQDDVIKDFTLDPGVTVSTTMVNGLLELGEIGLWSLNLLDGGGFVDVVGPLELYDIYSFGSLAINGTTIGINDSGTVGNVTLITSSLSGDAFTQATTTPASVTYTTDGTGAGTISLTNVEAVPMPNAFAMGCVVLALFVMLKRPRRIASHAV